MFFPKYFFHKFFSNFFSKLFFEGFTLDASPFTETKRTVCICVMKNMIYNKRSKLDSCDKVLFFDSYCSHHTRREKFSSYPATHNILSYFFRYLLYLI